MSSRATNHVSVPLLDVAGQNAPLRTQLIQAFEKIVDSGQCILGAEVESFEREIALRLRTKHAVGVSSGSDALLISLMALGIAPGDEIITTPFTFFSTAGCIVRLGARPVFVDIDPRTFNINATLIESAITPRTKAILPVHLFGQACDMGAIGAVAKRHNLVVVEDAAQAIGTTYQDTPVGTLGRVGCFSFFPSKNLGALGDGGLVVTQDDVLADTLRLMRVHGSRPKYFHAVVGGNFRLDALQAALLRVKLPHLDGWAKERARNAQTYTAMFKAAGIHNRCALPQEVEPGHIWNQYTLRTPQREQLKTHLSTLNIGHEVYYPLPMHLQTCFEHLGYQAGDLPESEKAANEVISIPIFPELGEERLQRVAQAVIDGLTLKNGT